MTSSAYRISSKEDPNLYPSIKAFIKANSHGDNQGRLCQVLQHYADSQSVQPSAHSGMDVGTDRADVDGDIWRSFPWLTMVFGSGALELRDAAGLAERLANAVEDRAIKLASGKSPLARALSAFNTDRNDGIRPVSELAAEFTRMLAVGRLGGLGDGDNVYATDMWGSDEANEAVHSDEATAVNVEGFAAGLVILAALLTRFYFTVQQRTVQPIARFDDDVVALSHEPDFGAPLPDHDAAAGVELIGSLLALARSDGGTSVNEEIKVAAVDLMEIIQADLRQLPRKLTLGNLRLVTEVGWYLLSFGQPIYSGWTDLMLFLTLNQGGVGPAPLYRNLTNLPEMVRKLHEDPTRASWGRHRTPSDGLGDDPTGRRDRLYGEAANVLWALGDAASVESLKLAESSSQPPLGDLLPPAVAFVTSFDIELDSAMWAAAQDRSAEEGQSFRVILPLHLTNESSEFAELCWVMADIDAAGTEPGTDEAEVDAELNQLRSPKNWRLVTDNIEETVLREMPIIVHLNGCPLYKLPGFSTSEAAALRADLARAGVSTSFNVKYDLHHAVTIGEYLALRQSETELIWHQHGRAHRHLNRSLHRHLMVSTDRNPRYWISMGVPVADAAVRHRLVSQLTRERLLEQADATGNEITNDDSWLGDTPQSTNVADLTEGLLGAGPPTPDADPPRRWAPARIGGVAVNLRIGPDAAGLLYWAGLNLVQGDCNDLTGELTHYAAHIRDPGTADKKPPSGAICNLGSGRNSEQS